MHMLLIGLWWLALVRVSVEALRFSRERHQALARTEAAEREVARLHRERRAPAPTCVYGSREELMAHADWGEPI